MLRRSFATLVLTVSLLIGSLAWSGFLALRTVLDPERSDDVAEALYDDESVRDALAENIAAAFGAALSDQVPVSQEQLDAAARTALASPAVETLIVDAFVATHRAFLGEGEAPDSLDAGAFGAAARDALVDQQPGLDGVLPASPAISVPLPTERMPNAGPLRDLLQTVVPVLALVATAGVLTALLATSDRPAVLRRAGFWAIGVSAVVLLFAFGVPWLAARFAPDQADVVAALVGALAATSRGPALAMAGSGVVGVVGSMVWRRSSGWVGDDVVSYHPSVAPPSMPAEPPKPRRGGRAVRRDMPVGPSTPHRSSPPPPPAPPRPRTPPGPPTAVSSRPDDVTELDPRWVEGHGWVIDPASQRIPRDARWVPGVGYVTDRAPTD